MDANEDAYESINTIQPVPVTPGNFITNFFAPVPLLPVVPIPTLTQRTKRKHADLDSRNPTITAQSYEEFTILKEQQCKIIEKNLQSEQMKKGSQKSSIQKINDKNDSGINFKKKTLKLN